MFYGNMCKLKYKKEIMKYGFEVGKISMKAKTVDFHKIRE